MKLKFTDSQFSKELNPHLNKAEMLLLEKVIEAIYPTPEFSNIAHQLDLLLNSSLVLNNLNLPITLRSNNEKLITLLTKVSKTEEFRTKLIHEPQPNDNKNVLSGMMQEYPFAALFSISVLDKTNENTKQIFYCLLSLIFWISFDFTSQLLLEFHLKEIRIFIEKYYNIGTVKNISSLNIEQVTREWISLLSQKKRINLQHFSLEKYVQQLHNIQPIRIEVAKRSIIDDLDYLSKQCHTGKSKPLTQHHINNITPIKNISPDIKTRTQKRQYTPVLKHKEDIAEDNRIELTDVSITTEHYIDEEALDQSYLYGSRLALQELMQLSLRPVALIDYEVSFITKRIEQSLLSDNIDEFKSAVLALLLLCTSKSYSYIESLPINTNEQLNTNTDCICLKTQTWNRLDVRMPEAFTATEAQKKHLENVEHLLCLPLPTLLIASLERLMKERNVNNISVKALFKEGEDEFLISRHITKLFDNNPLPGRNITAASIRNLFFEFISKMESPAIASLLLANTEYASNTSLYYLFQSHQKMVLVYRNSLRKLGFESHNIQVKSNIFCGSELAIQLWRTKLIVKEKYNELETSYKHIDAHSPIIESIQLHNQIALYCTVSLLITTGHRPRNEYSFCDFTINEDKGLILIADKRNFCDSSVRVLPIADVVNENIKAYRVHCDRLSRITKTEHSNLTQQLLKTSKSLSNTNQPLLYIINNDFTIQPIGYRDIKSYLNSWDLPENAFRHYFLSFLQSTTAKNVAGNFMGHIRSGEHIYANDSLFCYDDMLNIKSAINALADSLDCSPLAFPAKAGRQVPLINYDADNVYSPDYLIGKHTLNKDKLRHSVRKLISELYKDKTKFFKDILATKDQLLENILEEDNLTTRELNYKLKMLDKFIIKIVGTKKLPSISKTYADKETKGLRLNSGSLFLAKEAEIVKQSILTWLLSEKTNKSMSKNMANREFLKVILSLIINASFSFTIDVEFLRALKSPLYKDGNILWLTWTDSNNKKQRIFIDAITAQFIINNPIYLQTKLKHPSEISKTLFHYLSKEIKKLPIQKILIGKKRIDINTLIKFLNNGIIFTHSGLSQSYLNQKRQTTHLPDEVLTRWLRDSPCYKEISDESPSDEFTPQSLQRPKKERFGDKGIVLGAKILSEIRDKLNQRFSESGFTSSEMLISIVRDIWASAIDIKPEKDLQQMINKSERLSEATIAVLCWLYYTAGKPGKGRKTIAIRTLLSYLSKVAKPLIVTADSQPFFRLSKSEVESLYIKVIESRKVKNKKDAAESLRVFDNYIYDNFKVPRVDWLEIEPSINSRTDNVKANIISYREYEEIRLHLQNDGSFTTDGRLINKTIFTLCYRLGLRKSEAENLMVDEVDFVHGIIHIRTNRYDRVKTLKSNRRIPFYLFLSIDEINDLKQLVQRILQFNNHKTNIGIFSRPLDDTKLIDFTPHTEAIAQMMKTVTHDPSMSLHVCRHSFANYLYLLVCRGELPPSIFNELNTWSREKDSFQEFTKKLTNTLINEPHSPHKILHAISLLLGHEEVSTTIKNYIHVLDIISAAENEKLLNQTLKIKQLKHVNKLSISHANHIVSRFDGLKRRHIAICYHQLKQFAGYTEVDVIRINDKKQLPNKVQSIKTTNSLLYNLSMIEVVIRAVEESQTIENIAKKVTFSELKIAQIIQITEQLKSDTAYDGIIVHSSIQNITFYNNPAKSKKTKAYVKNLTYKTILNKLNNLNAKKRSSLLRIWHQNYNRSTPGYTITDKIDGEQFLSIINHLDYKLITKDDSYILKKNSKTISLPLYTIIDPAIGTAKNSINLKFDHALFLIAINDALEKTTL